jgi:KDO2-lipid IV(A) lauroyltransferase
MPGPSFDKVVPSVRPVKIPLLIALMRLLALLPLAWLGCLGRLLGRGLWLANGRERQITERNLARCLPELDADRRQQLARASLEDFGQTALEMARMWFASPHKVLDAVVAVEGDELVSTALAEGEGVILLAPHHGNWELLGMYLGRRWGVTSMYLRNKRSAELDRLVRAVRSRDGATLVPADASGVRALLQALRQGRLVAILPDQEPKQAGAEFAPFFATPALTMTLASNLLRKTGARAVLAYALRLESGGFRIVFREPDPELYSTELARSLAGLNRSVEACARDHPAQYQWEYKRFKTQPEGCPELY